MSAFRFNNEVDGTCEVYIQNLGTDMDSPVVLGSMFLSQYIAYFENDASTGLQTMALTPSLKTMIINSTYIGD
jgi:hypothetical protein